MAVGDVKVIGSFVSPFVMRPRIALNMKGVSYEFLEEEYGSKSELLLKSNPVYKKVPVLLHGDKVICESMIIVEYIDSVWRSSDAAPLVSSDPYHRAMARFWAVFVDDKWFPSMIGSIKPSTAEAKKACADQLIEATQLLETAFEKCSKGKPFFAGDCIGYLDIAFGSYLAGLKATEKVADVNILDERKTPLLLRWAERFCTDEAVKPVMPEPDDLVEYWKTNLQKHFQEEADAAAAAP